VYGKIKFILRGTYLPTLPDAVGATPSGTPFLFLNFSKCILSYVSD